MSDPPEEPSGPVPARRLTSEQLEAVIRRAVELQAGGESGGGTDDLSEDDAVRIGQELGLSPEHLQRAIAEVEGRPTAETGLLARTFGQGRIATSRAVPRPAGDVRSELHTYLCDRETLSVQRRFAERTVYEPAPGVMADMTRMMRSMHARGDWGHFRLSKARSVAVGVRGTGERSCFVTLAADLTPVRTGWATGGVVSGSGAGGATALVLALVVAPPAALLGVPVAAGSLWGMQAAYRASARRASEKLEGMLDRLEHGEPLSPPRSSWTRALGA